MPIYGYRCDGAGCGVRFDRLLPVDADAPGCPACGGVTRKVPGRISLGGRAGAGPSREQLPQTWRGLYDGNREYVTQVQRTWERRQNLEARHPELAGDERPVLAHEGRYHDTPLRAGDVPTHGHGSAPAAGHDRRPGTETGRDRADPHRNDDHGDSAPAPAPAPSRRPPPSPSSPPPS